MPNLNENMQLLSKSNIHNLPWPNINVSSNENFLVNKKYIITPYSGTYSSTNNSHTNNNSILERGYNDIDTSSNIVDYNFSFIEQKLSLSYNYISSYLSNVFSYLGKGSYHLPIPEMNLPNVMSLPSDRFAPILQEKLSKFNYNLPVLDTPNIGIGDSLISIFNGCDHRLSILFIVLILFSIMSSFVGIILSFISSGIRSLYIVTCRGGYKRADQIFTNLRNYNGSNGRWRTYNWYRTSMNEPRKNYSDDDDGDDRKRRRNFYKGRQLSPLPSLIRFMEILHQLLNRYFPIFMGAIDRFEAYSRTLSSSNIMGMMRLSPPRIIMSEFRNHMISFSVRLREAYLMLVAVLENIRRYIIDNVQNSNLDDPFLVLERWLRRFRSRTNRAMNDWYLTLISEIRRTSVLNRNPQVFLNFIQNLWLPMIDSDTSYMNNLRERSNEIKTLLTDLYEYINDLINRFF